MVGRRYVSWLAVMEGRNCTCDGDICVSGDLVVPSFY